MDLIQFANKKVVNKLNKLGNRLPALKDLIDWKAFDTIIEQMRKNKTSKGGRPNKDNIMMLKILVLQKWYSLSDEQVEYQVLDRASFQDFLGISYTQVPDFSTVWYFRDDLRKHNLFDQIWEELQDQINKLGFEVKEGHIQDASFTEAQPGKKRQYKERKAKRKGEKISYTPKQLSHIDQDARYTVKNNQIHYGYKDHIKCDVDFQFVRSFNITPAQIHDNNINLDQPDDIALYRDKGYSGHEPRYPQVNDFTMIRKESRTKQWVKSLNKYISTVRAKGERPFSVTKYVFKGGYTFAKSIERVTSGQFFVYFAYNLYNLFSFRNKIKHPN